MMSDFIKYAPLVPLVLGLILLLFFALVLRDALNNAPTASAKRHGFEKWRHYAKIQLAVARTDANYQRVYRQFLIGSGVTVLALAAALGAALPEFSGWDGVTYTWWWLALALVAAFIAILGWRKAQQLQFEALTHLKNSDEKQFNQLAVTLDHRWLGQLLSTSKYLLIAICLFLVTVVCYLGITYLGY